MKSQVALEYIIIISIGLIALIPFVIYSYNSAYVYSEQNKIETAINSLNELGESIDWVYSQGEPAKLVLDLYIPKLENVSIVNNIIIWKVKTSAGISDIYYKASANITGTLPTNEGYYNIFVKAVRDGVEIGVE